MNEPDEKECEITEPDEIERVEIPKCKECEITEQDVPLYSCSCCDEWVCQDCRIKCEVCQNYFCPECMSEYSTDVDTCIACYDEMGGEKYD